MSPSPAIEFPGAEPGAYLLAIDLKRKLTLKFASFSALPSAPVLMPGRYVYCGSAYGPGGLAARIARHLKRGKTVRWLVDSLTLAGRIVQTAALAGGSECALFAALHKLPGVLVPVPGFGSSDCRDCAAHLLAVPMDFDIADYLSAFRSRV